MMPINKRPLPGARRDSRATRFARALRLPAHTATPAACSATAYLPGDKLLASGCKRQGFCPLSGARHMSQTAAHPVKHLIPCVSVRLWELSLLTPLCVHAARPDRVTLVL